MISAALLLLASTASEQPPLPTEGGPVSQFISACIDGKLKLQAEPERIAFKKLPYSLRTYLDEWKQGTFYKITRPSEAYLLLQTSNPSADGSYVENCALASRKIELKSAFARVFLELSGAQIEEEPSKRGILTASNQRDGYLFVAYPLAPSIMVAKPLDVHFRLLLMKIDQPAKKPTGEHKPEQVGEAQPPRK